MRYKIDFEHHDGTADSFIFSAETPEEIRKMFDEQTKDMNINKDSCYSTYMGE